MIKLAKTIYDLHPLIKKRFSPHGFKDEPIEKEQLLKLLEAASWAPSSYNEQPWRFIIGIKGDTGSYDKIFSCLNEHNQHWAGSAPVLLISVGKKMLTRNNAPNRFHAFDSGQAVAMMSIQAAHEDIYIHQMGGFDAIKAQKIFHIPEEYEVLAAMAVGKIKHDPSQMDEIPKDEIFYRNRKEIESFTFENDWEIPFK